MNKITFMGAGSTVFVRNVLGGLYVYGVSPGLGIRPVRH